jgi:hypothetical protein
MVSFFLSLWKLIMIRNQHDDMLQKGFQSKFSPGFFSLVHTAHPCSRIEKVFGIQTKKLLAVVILWCSVGPCRKTCS